MKFTESVTARLDPGVKAEVWRRDERLTGYAVRARRLADGSIQRTFFVIYQIRDDDGTRKTIKVQIGVWKNPWTEADARVEAQRLLAQRDRGHRMVSGKAQARSERRVSDLVAQFQADHLPKKKPQTAKEYDRALRKHVLPALGAMPVASVSRADIRDLHQSLAKVPYVGNRCLAVVSRMFAYAVEREWRTDNPAMSVRRFPEHKRESWLNREQLPRFLAALNKHEEPHFELLRFLTVTGWRVQEAIGLTWDSVDLPHMVVRLSDTKTGKSVRALSSDAATLLDRQRHRVGYCFSRSAGHEPVSYKRVRLVLRDLCKEAHIVPAITPHSLRRTSATYASIAGASVQELMKTYGWRTSQVATQYVQASELLSRAGAEKAAGAINVFQKPAAAIKPMPAFKYEAEITPQGVDMRSAIQVICLHTL